MLAESVSEAEQGLGEFQNSAVFGNKDQTTVQGHLMLQNRGKKLSCFYFSNSLNLSHSGSYICIFSPVTNLKDALGLRKACVLCSEQSRVSSTPVLLTRGKGLACLPGGWDGYKTACVCMPLLQTDIPLPKASSHTGLELRKFYLRAPFRRLHSFPGF